MIFNPSPTELTTGATDAVIVAVSVACVLWLRRSRRADPRRVAIWSWVFGLLAFAATLGAIAHGLDLGEGVQTWLWRPLYLSLGIVVALFVMGALHDAWGEQLAKRALLPLLAIGVVFFAVTQMIPGTFLVFVVYEAVALLAALGMYGTLAVRRRLAGAGVVGAGIVLNIVAAAIQATGAISVTIVVPFDHNGVFHLVQIVALIVMISGLTKGMVRPSTVT